MFAVHWPVTSKTSNSFARCFPLSSYIGVTLFQEPWWLLQAFVSEIVWIGRATVHPQTETSCRHLLATLKRRDNIFFACCIEDFAGSAGRFSSAWLLYFLPPCKYLMRPTNLLLLHSWLHRSKNFLSNSAKGVFCVASSPRMNTNTPSAARIAADQLNTWFDISAPAFTGCRMIQPPELWTTILLWCWVQICNLSEPLQVMTKFL